MIYKIYTSYKRLMEGMKDLPLLIIRGVLVYGFYTPALYKISDFSGTAEWFAGMGMPFPTLNAYLAGITEFLGVILLTLGLGTRIIAIPMIITMLVAIFTVHIDHGFSAASNGFEIPFYFIIFLFTLIVYGPGRISVDHLISKRRRSN